MRKIFTAAIAIIFAFTISAQAQSPSIYIESFPDEIPNTTVLIPVNVDFTSNDVCAIDIEISFDEDVLTFEGLSNVASLGGTPLTSQTTSPIKIGWNTSANQHNDKIFDLRFTYLGGFSELKFERIDVIGGTAIFQCPDGTTVMSVNVGDNDAFINGPTVVTAVPIAIWSLLGVFGLMMAFFVRRLF